MKRTIIALPFLLAMSWTAPAQDNVTATAAFVDMNGVEIGTVSLTESDAGVVMELDIAGLPEAGWVGFHVHEHGVCSPEDAFESAGAHFNPDNAEHGYLAPTGPHAGDMPNQYVPDDGHLRAEVFNSFVSLHGESNGIAGHTLMIHAEPDDYVSQPGGDAGDRIACAVIEVGAD
jgi:superoxide dismutase, Cu-Zn family